MEPKAIVNKNVVFAMVVGQCMATLTPSLEVLVKETRPTRWHNCPGKPMNVSIIMKLVTVVRPAKYWPNCSMKS